jgi:chromosome segregation ATPase
MEISELKKQKEQIEFALKVKEDAIKILEEKVEGLNVQVGELMKAVQVNKAEGSALSGTEIRAELSKKDMLIAAYQNDIEQKKMELERMDKEIIEGQIKINNLETTLKDLNKKISESRFYPAMEVKSRQKNFVSLRFIQNQNKEYVLEVLTAKGKRQYSFEDVEVHLHTSKDNYVIVESKEDNKKEAFETEFALAIHENYIHCVLANSYL